MTDPSCREAQSDPVIDRATACNFGRTIITVLCAAALVVLAVVVTMLPFVLL
jgi:hypothetical protein